MMGMPMPGKPKTSVIPARPARKPATPANPVVKPKPPAKPPMKPMPGMKPVPEMEHP